jgi:hypothetical protein
MLKDQKDLLRALNAHKVDYLVVGGHAAIAYGNARFTGDIDIWIRRSKENSIAVFRALVEFGAPLADIKPEDFNTSPTDYFQFGVVPDRIDILQGIEGVEFDDAWSRRVEMTVEDGLTAPYLSLEDLLHNKKAVGRPKDIADIHDLQRIQELKKK